ncbi:MAG: hypothetical protein A2048_06680 [Deltaproteobacteria bacterium GWA2_45_12]|nr:MAG: hypothetical protein A2048_06680 [Deltaproteobacteria bacterium GWA2_45_12]
MLHLGGPSGQPPSSFHPARLKKTTPLTPVPIDGFTLGGEAKLEIAPPFLQIPGPLRKKTIHTRGNIPVLSGGIKGNGGGFIFSTEDVDMLCSGLATLPERGGGYLGIGSFHHLDVALTVDADAIVLADIDPQVASFNKALLQAIEQLDGPEQGFDALVAVANKKLSYKGQPLHEREWLHMYTHGGGELPDTIVDARTPLLWAKDEKVFQRLKWLITQKRIAVAHLDAFDPNSMRPVAQFLAQHRLGLRWAHLSNIEHPSPMAIGMDHRRHLLTLPTSLRAAGAGKDTIIITSMPRWFKPDFAQYIPDKIQFLPELAPPIQVDRRVFDFIFAQRRLITLDEGLFLVAPQEKVTAILVNLPARWVSSLVTLGACRNNHFLTHDFFQTLIFS